MKIFSFAVLCLAATAASQTYTLTDFGTQCGGDLQGQIVTAPGGTGIRLGVTGAHRNTITVLVIGHPQAAPVQLPGSACLLLVDPRAMLHELTSPSGTAGFGFRLPPIVPITIDFQAVIVGHAASGRVFESTDGVHLVGV